MGKFSDLENSLLTRSWSLEEKAALAHFLVPIEIKKGDVLINPKVEGDRALFFVHSGSLEIEINDFKMLLGSGESFGEFSIVTKTKKLGRVKAIENSKLWSLSYESWMELKRSSPVVAQRLTESILQKVATLLEKSPLH